MRFRVVGSIVERVAVKVVPVVLSAFLFELGPPMRPLACICGVISLGRTVRFAKSRLFSTTGSHRS